MRRTLQLGAALSVALLAYAGWLVSGLRGPWVTR